MIAEVCDVGKKDYALGLERMFFRLGCAAFLEELSEADPVPMATKHTRRLDDWTTRRLGYLRVLTTGRVAPRWRWRPS